MRSQVCSPNDARMPSADAEQCFLIGYRAACHEVYQRTAGVRAVQAMRELADRGQPEAVQLLIQQSYDALDAGAHKGLVVVESLKRRMDEQLVRAEYSGWSKFILKFEGQLCVASTGAVSPNRDVHGRQLQVLHETEAVRQQTLLYGMVATETGGAVVFMWPSSETVARRLIESFGAGGQEGLPALIAQFMFAFVENTYFSERWWRSLPEETQQHLRNLALMSNAYYTDFSYISEPFLPWAVVHAAFDDAA